jgi:hypothetical protein
MPRRRASHFIRASAKLCPWTSPAGRS